MKKYIQFGDPLLERIRRRYLFHWILLLIINIFPQVSYPGQLEDPTAFMAFIRVIIYSVLLFVIIYTLSYFTYMMKKYTEDVLVGIVWGCIAGTVVGMIYIAIGPEYNMIAGGSILWITFSTLFGTYSLSTWIAPATATSIGITAGAVSAGVVMVYPLIGVAHIGIIALYGVAVIGVHLVMMAFIVSLPALFQASQKHTHEITDAGYLRHFFILFL